MTYAEKLKDPRWQKKRLEVLEDHHFDCDNCGNEKNELHVHHKMYVKGKEPWDYEWEDFSVLCKNCHSELHKAMDSLKEAMSVFVCAEQIYMVVGFALATSGDDIFPKELANREAVLGYASFFQTNEDVINQLLREAKEEGFPISPTKILYKQSYGV